MSIFNFISNIFKPAVDLIDESRLMEAQSSIIRSESGGQSWLQRSWRPIVMLSFLLLVICDSFGLLAFRLADQAWTLLQIGLGGYVIGRSAEKIIPGLMRRRQGVAVG